MADVWTFIAADAPAERATHFIQALERAFIALLNHPLIGPGLRVHLFRAIHGVPDNGEIVIVRVVYGSRDRRAFGADANRIPYQDGWSVIGGPRKTSLHAVTPAKAGVYLVLLKGKMDSGLRRNDEIRAFFEVLP